MFAPIPVPVGHSLPWHTHGDRVYGSSPKSEFGERCVDRLSTSSSEKATRLLTLLNQTMYYPLKMT